MTLSEERLTLAFSAWPLADAALTQELLDLIQNAKHLGQAKKGANEGMSIFLAPGVGRPWKLG